MLEHSLAALSIEIGADRVVLFWTGEDKRRRQLFLGVTLRHRKHSSRRQNSQWGDYRLARPVSAVSVVLLIRILEIVNTVESVCVLVIQ